MISLFLISFSFANSAYLKDVPQKLNQPDGTELNCFATGDEFFNWLHDASGYTIIQNTTNGWYVYANLINDEMVPTNLIAGRDNPSSIGLRPWLIYSEQKLRSFRSKFSIPKQFQRIDKKSEKLQAASNKGVLNNVAIFIRFADETSFKQNKTYFNTPYNATGQI